MKREVRYGLYYGGFSILWMLVMYVTELNRSASANSLNYVSLLILGYLIIQFVKEVKSENEGYISFSRIFKGGLLIGTLGGVISSIFFYVQVKFIDTGYIDFVLNQALVDMQKKGMSDELIDQSMKMAEKWTTAEFFLLIGIVGSLFISSFVSIILALIIMIRDVRNMFINPFSFEGRIRRAEYGLSIIIVAIINYLINYCLGADIVFFLLCIPLIWFLYAQGAKRCHDLQKSGWWQLIPFYGFWLIFQDGNKGENQYGENPKGFQNTENDKKPNPNEIA
jgi:uncharacterized membrane protein YhaH (DUF805 family)